MTADKIAEAPERIWAINDECAGWAHCHGGGPMVAGEQEYVRADLANELAQENAKLRQRIEELEGAVMTALLSRPVPERAL